MAIVSSQIIEDRVQVDGRRSVRERHTDDLDSVHDVSYLAEAEANISTTMAARVAQIEASLLEAEHQANLSAVGESGNGATFRYTTQAQFLVRLRILYAVSTGLRACFIGRWFHLASLADATLRTLFGITQGQVGGLRTKFSNQNTLLTNLGNENGVYP
jgi:hypothetical protein